jgi:hypothetical protein
MITKINNLVTCTSCKHFHLSLLERIIRINPELAKCNRTKYTKENFNIVTGKWNSDIELEYCSVQRRPKPTTGACGEEGKHWVPKNKKDLFKLITRI